MHPETTEQAKEQMSSVGIIPKPNVVYNFYECGCVFDHINDPGKPITYHGKYVKSCGIHKGKSFKTKYKICECGFEQFGKCLKPGHCQTCSLRKSDQSKIGGPSRKERKKILARNKIASAQRYDCGNRDGCLNEFFRSTAKSLPCFGCDRYFRGVFQP